MIYLKKYNEINRGLERQRRFDTDYLPKGKHYVIPDKNYRFEHKNVFVRLWRGFVMVVLRIIGPILVHVAYGYKVRGKQNLRALGKKGALSVSNHIDILDSLLVKQTTGYVRSFHTAAVSNNRAKVGGAFLHAGGLIPLGGSFEAQKNRYAYIDKLCKKGKIVNFMAEQALWLCYKKPRPYKNGVFHCAVTLGLPILPIFFSYERTRLRKNCVVANILPPEYPRTDLSPVAAREDLKNRVSESVKATYERVYGQPLVYEGEPVVFAVKPTLLPEQKAQLNSSEQK